MIRWWPRADYGERRRRGALRLVELCTHAERHSEAAQAAQIFGLWTDLTMTWRELRDSIAAAKLTKRELTKLWRQCQQGDLDRLEALANQSNECQSIWLDDIHQLRPLLERLRKW